MPRTSEQTTRCRFCHKILVNNVWMVERREYHVKYRASTCPQCEVYQLRPLIEPVPAQTLRPAIAHI